MIKCGLAPVLIDLMRRGYATAFAMNGAAAIHDFEIALAGHTSEDVEAVLPDGRFGAAEETGREMNARDRGGRPGRRWAWAKRWGDGWLPRASAWQGGQSAGAGVPQLDSGHGARGHRHGYAAHASGGRCGAPSGAPRIAISACSAPASADLNEGGVYLNVGSAVVLPEVFLKAVSAVRNLGHPLAEFTTVNFDFLQHYRPRVNVVERPHKGGASFSPPSRRGNAPAPPMERAMPSRATTS